MPHGKNTQEYRIIKKNYPNLSGAIAGVIDWVCQRLLAEGLITDGQKAEASNGMIPANKRASDVTALLLNKVEQDAQNFQTLIGVLQQDTDTFGTVLKHMGVTDASGSTSGATVSSTCGPGDTNYLCTPANLEIELKEITQPHQFGLQLGVAPSDLEQIERNHRGDVARQRSEVIIFWSRNYECTWEKVAEAVKKLGGHGNLEKRLRQLHTKGPNNSSSASVHPNPKEDEEQVTVKPKASLKFSDNLSPNDLVAWLSQELDARGLTLSEELKGKLIEEEINGQAFKDLSKEDLKEMGFKIGSIKNIIKILEELKQTNAEA